MGGQLIHLLLSFKCHEVAFVVNWYCINEMAWNWPCVLPRKSMQHSAKSFFAFFVYLAALTEQVTLHVLLSVWCKVVMWAEQERGRKGGLWAAITQAELLPSPTAKPWKRQPSPSCSACLRKSCYNFSGDSTSCGLRGCCVLLRYVEGACFFSWFADPVKYAVQHGICSEVIYWQCRLRCKIHTCCS